MRPSFPLRWVLVLVWVSGAACKCEGGKLGQAFGDFLDFSKGDSRVTDPLGKTTTHDYTLRSWKEDFGGGRSRALAVIEVDHSIDPDKLTKVLRDACHDDGLLRSSAVVKVLAYPGKLEQIAFPLGEAVFARDGHGWEGTGVGFETIRVFLPPPDRLAANGAVPLQERDYLTLLGLDNLLRRGVSETDAVAQVASNHGTPESEVAAALARGRKFFELLRLEAETAAARSK